MDLGKKRKMMEILRGLVGSGFVGGQADIAKHLKKKGFNVTQSTVSRSLTKIGAIKTKKDGKTAYTLPSTRPAPQFAGHSFGNLILSTENNENMIVVKTTPGSAMFVAGFIDHYCKSYCMGTVAGDDTILVVPKSSKEIKSSAKQLKQFFSESN